MAGNLYMYNLVLYFCTVNVQRGLLQCPLDIATLDKAAALAIATTARVTDLRHYMNSDLGYSDRKFSALFTK